MRIDLSRVDRESFNVTEREGRVLVVPKKMKFHWAEDELHLRSLLTDLDGTVLSSGFPKFFNLGENQEHDEAFDAALEAGEVRFSHKWDGSLIVASCIEGRAHFRTRGSHSLGEFHDPVMQCVEKTRIVEFVESWAGSSSFLFEYTAPSNRIVVGYEEPKLTFLGYIDLETLRPVLQAGVLEVLAEEMGVPAVQYHNLPPDLEDLLSVIGQWKDAEGVVARFTYEGRPMLLKLKSDWYLALHALRFRLSDRRLRRFCFLQEIFSREAFLEELAHMGHDFEVMSYFEEPFWQYQQDRDSELHYLSVTRGIVESARGSATKKEFVLSVREQLAGLPKECFTMAMFLYNGREEDARLVAEARALGESPLAVREWLKDRASALDEILNVRVLEEV